MRMLRVPTQPLPHKPHLAPMQDFKIPTVYILFWLPRPPSYLPTQIHSSLDLIFCLPCSRASPVARSFFSGCIPTNFLLAPMDFVCASPRSRCVPASILLPLWSRLSALAHAQSHPSTLACSCLPALSNACPHSLVPRRARPRLSMLTRSVPRLTNLLAPSRARPRCPALARACLLPLPPARARPRKCPGYALWICPRTKLLGIAAGIILYISY